MEWLCAPCITRYSTLARSQSTPNIGFLCRRRYTARRASNVWLAEVEERGDELGVLATLFAFSPGTDVLDARALIKEAPFFVVGGLVGVRSARWIWRRTREP